MCQRSRCICYCGVYIEGRCQGCGGKRVEIVEDALFAKAAELWDWQKSSGHCLALEEDGWRYGVNPWDGDEIVRDMSDEELERIRHAHDECNERVPMLHAQFAIEMPSCHDPFAREPWGSSQGELSVDDSPNKADDASTLEWSDGHSIVWCHPEPASPVSSEQQVLLGWETALRANTFFVGFCCILLPIAVGHLLLQAFLWPDMCVSLR